MTRLKGSDWHDVKSDIIIECFTTSGSGNIAVFGKNKNTGETVLHWLNDIEKQEFKKENYPEKSWDELIK